jgi:heme/copper-type cytochrome/quinol oxidase subunit 2
MSDSDNKKGVNFPLLIGTILIVAVMIGIATMKVLDSRIERKIDKVKITEGQLSDFIVKTDEMVAKYTVRNSEDGTPVVHPPAGSDVYILARNYDFGKFTLELEKGKTYNLKLASKDMKHAIVVHELKLQNRIKVGEIKTIEFVPVKAGTFNVICGEFCGAGHASMVGKIIVTE